MNDTKRPTEREVRAFKAWREVVSGYRGLASPIQKRTLAGLVQRWIETGTPSYLDDALIYCEINNLPVTSELRKHLASGASARIGGKTTKALREGYKDKAFLLMVNLIFHGASLREASGKAAVWISSQNLGYTVKASSLEKDYPLKYRQGQPSLEEEFHNEWRTNPQPEYDAGWERIRKELPEPSDEERGERR